MDTNTSKLVASNRAAFLADLSLLLEKHKLKDSLDASAKTSKYVDEMMCIQNPKALFCKPNTASVGCQTFNQKNQAMLNSENSLRVLKYLQAQVIKQSLLLNLITSKFQQLDYCIQLNQ